MTNEAQPYKFSFSTGTLFHNESIEVARLYERSQSWRTAIDEALEGRVAMLPKIASQRRTLREIVNRLSTLTDAQIAFLANDADRFEQSALLWLATCRAYRIVREFAVDVICERWRARRYDLHPESFDLYFQSRAEWDARLEKIQSSTRRRLRQVLFRIMREVGLLGTDDTLQPLLLSDRLYALIGETDLAVFPGASRRAAS